MNAEEYNKLLYRISQEIEDSSHGLLNKFPLGSYVSLLRSRRETAPYNSMPENVKIYCSEIIRYANKKALRGYHRLLLIDLIRENVSKLNDINLPDDIKSLYLKAFEMICEDMKLNTYDYYEYSNDKFVKDLNICLMKLIPIGPGVVDLSRIARRFLFRKGVVQFFKGLFFIYMHTGGFEPFYQGHVYLRGLADYSKREWDLAYCRIANLMEIDKQVKGYFGYGWYFDPVIKEISPHLAYKRIIFEKNGGRIFYIGSTADAIRDATLKSKTRRKLFDEGKYIPTKYMFIWPRKQVIRWARKYRSKERSNHETV